MWHRLGFGKDGETIHVQPWPRWVEDDLKQDTIEMVTQIKGKIRDRIVVPADASEEEIRKIAMGSEKIKSLLQGTEVKKIIVVPGRLVNIIN